MLLAKNLLFTLVVPGTVAVYLPYRLARPLAPGPAALASALPLFFLGAAVYAWCVWDFATFGRGTPAPVDPPRRLVVRGLFRRVRNPMYLGVLTVLLGWLVLAPGRDLAAYLAGTWLVFHSVVVLYEEPRLHSHFGADYDRYAARVGRWLPRLRPR